ncbi:WGR domain-containing protein [Nostoc sp.]
MNDITLYKTDPAKNLFRFYYLDIQADLFGNPCLIRRWGRIGKAGQMKTMPFLTLEAAERELVKYYQIKSSRGYKPHLTQASASTLH